MSLLYYAGKGSQFFWPGVNTAWHFGQRISVKLVRWVSFGGIWYRHLGHSVVNDAMTLALSTLRPIYFFFFAALIFAHRARCAAAIRLRPAAEILRRALRSLPIDTALTPPSSFTTCSIRAMSFRISAMMPALLNVFSVIARCDQKG
jgi:hypothetical protein